MGRFRQRIQQTMNVGLERGASTCSGYRIGLHKSQSHPELPGQCPPISATINRAADAQADAR